MGERDADGRADRRQRPSDLGFGRISGDTIAAVTGGDSLRLRQATRRLGERDGGERHLLPASFTSSRSRRHDRRRHCIAGRAVAYVFRQVPATITVTKHLVPAFDPGRFDLKVGGTVVKAAAGDCDVGSIVVAPGTYRVSESGVAGTSPSDYSTSIACTLNEKPGPVGERNDPAGRDRRRRRPCRLRDHQPAQGTVSLTKTLNPAADPGRFDLKVTSSVASSGEGERRQRRLRLDPASSRHVTGESRARRPGRAWPTMQPRSPAQ